MAEELTTARAEPGESPAETPKVSPFATTNVDGAAVDDKHEAVVADAESLEHAAESPDLPPAAPRPESVTASPAELPPNGHAIPRRRSVEERPIPLPRSTAGIRDMASKFQTTNPGRDSSRWRRGSIRTRTFGLALVCVLFLAVLAGAAAIGVISTSDTAQRSAELVEARRVNDRSITDLEEVHRLVRSADPAAGSAKQIEDRIRRLSEPMSLAAEARESVAIQAQLGQVVASEAAYVTSVREVTSQLGSGGPIETSLTAEQSAFALAQMKRTQFDVVLRAAESSARRHLETLRNRSLIAVGVALFLGSSMAIAGGFAVARSVTRPMRVLAQSMRRFGDGDLQARNVEAGDEVGLMSRSFNSLADGLASRVRQLSTDAERVTQQRIISEALDLAADETDIERIVEHSFSILAPGTPSELLVAESGSSQLRQLVTNPTVGAPNCPVGLTGSCVAIRWGRTMSFDRPDALNACPLLRDRATGPCSATCIPINVSGVVGVLHATGPVDHPPQPQLVEQLVTLASQTGSRIGSIRTLERTRLQASTDTLTGLANRRTLESALQDLIRTTTPFVLVVADLDEFKNLNDRYGHEVGDRALQMFARVLTENVRGLDIVARFGGEEFVLVYPEMDIGRSMEVIERMRFALIEAIASSDLPSFTCSFGVTHSSSAVDVDAVIRIADAGLMLAKELGRDRVVYSDAELAAEVFSPERSRARVHPLGVDPGGIDLGRATIDLTDSASEATGPETSASEATAPETSAPETVAPETVEPSADEDGQDPKDLPDPIF